MSNNQDDFIKNIDATVDPKLTKFIKTKSYKELEKWIKPKYPMNIWISGDTGLGKSSAVLKIKQLINEPVVRVNLSFSTDIDDLIGGIRIINGETIFQPGPVIKSMMIENCTLLLDEIDQADPRILMDLQPILEGKGYLIKKTSEMIYPKEGFSIIATANTKGKGDDTGNWIGANVLNKAFLDRFDLNINFEPPTKGEMKKIISSVYPELNDILVSNLASWYTQIIESEKNGVTVETLSPRKMLSIAKAFLCENVHSFVDSSNIIKLCINRYEDDVKEAFLSLWDVCAEEIIEKESKQQKNQQKSNDNDKVLDEEGDEVLF